MEDFRRRLLRRAVTPGLRRLPVLDRAVRGQVLSRNLRRLNDALSETALADRYWVWGGVLLGWARDGALLSHDLRDADFIVASEDERLVHDAIPAMLQAGFKRQFCYRNNDQRITEYTFTRDGIEFDFFLIFPDSEAGYRRYFSYTSESRELIQLEGRIREPQLERFAFLQRSWLKPKHHEDFLTAVYGDWKNPDPAWSAVTDLSVVARQPWNSTDYIWA